MSFRDFAELRDILSCPMCKSALEFSGEEVACRECAQKISKFENAVVFHSPQLPARFYNPEYTSSNCYTRGSLDLIRECSSGRVLDLGAGLASIDFPNVVQLELRKYAGTDVVLAGFDILPFVDEAFDAVVCQAVLEHVTDPFLFVSEIRRVLKTGGQVVLDAAFLQPLHGAPSHYFNTTLHAVESLFSDFKIASLRPEPYQHPWLALRWMLNSYTAGLRSEQDREAFRSMTIGELEKRFLTFDQRWEQFVRAHANNPNARMDWWQDAYGLNQDILAGLTDLSTEAMNELAAGFCVRATKSGQVGDRRQATVRESEVKRASSVARIKEKLFPTREIFDDVIRIDQTVCASHCGDIFGPARIVQSFCLEGKISRIDLMFATYMRNNSRDVRIRLCDTPGCEKDLVRFKVNASQFKDNQYYQFSFDPVRSKLGSMYYLVIDSPESFLGNCITVRCSDGKVLQDGSLEVNGKSRDQDLTFRVYTYERVVALESGGSIKRSAVAL